MRASIITPTLDAADFIDACVANVAAEGAAVREHIVVDGGSRDGTVERVAALARVHPALRLVRAPGLRQSAAMNLGTQAARGGIIGILNADDYYQRGAVARGIAGLAAVGAPAFVAGTCLIVDAADRPLLWNRADDLRLESLLLGWAAAQFPCNPSCYFYHREVHALVGGYDVDDDHQMDFDFVLKCAARVTMRYVPEHWGNFRLRPGTRTAEDRDAVPRRAALIARHVALLDPARRATMARIGIEKQRGAARP